MARATMRFLSSDEEDTLHGQSLRSLEELGVLVRSRPVLDMLEGAGAEVDYDKMIARMPETMVMDAVRKAPREFTLCARDSRHDLKVPVAGIPFMANTGLASYMMDMDTGERRNATVADVTAFARLCDAMDLVDFFWTPVVPMDVPDMSHAAHLLWTSLLNTTKHVQQVEVMSAEDAKVQIGLAELFAGGAEELGNRPLFSVVCSPISPMSFEKGSVEAQVEFSRAGVPIVSMNMPISGFTSPVTIAGTMNVVNVENLASLVISQCAAEGAPFVYSSAAAPADMRTGSLPSGPAEMPAIAAGLSQLAGRYGLPCMIGGWGMCDGVKPGADMTLSEVSSYAAEMFSATDLASGLGSMDGAKGAALEQIVIDAYTWGNFRSSLRETKVDERSVALDALKAVGHAGTFISHPQTLRDFRESISVRDESKRSWEATLSYGMVEEARALAKKILDEHAAPETEMAIVERGESVIREYERSTMGT
ncbi:MAG: trimethylamine methyltransferase family protein [Methanobacteriota archaeon]|nr:MAG: trimethylamine methyltransferase family protein [Euryarchaeota archaeon]